MSDLAAVTQHVAAQIILASKLETHPFPHIEVSNLVPDAYYAQMMREMPAAHEFSPVSDDGKNFEFNPQGSTEFWLGFATIVCVAIMRTALYKFEAVADRYFSDMRWRGLVKRGLSAGSIMAGRPNYGAQIFRRRNSYATDPHFHNITEVVSCLYYMPDDSDHAELGTELYEVASPFRATFAELAVYSAIDKASARLAKTARYLPNHALIYLNTPWSIHGNAPYDTGYERRFALLALHAPPRQMMPAAATLRSRINPFATRFAPRVFS